MNYDHFNCLVCTLHYDSSGRVPKQIPSCGHTICLLCLNKALAAKSQSKCPLDNILIEPWNKAASEFQTNHKLLALNLMRDQELSIIEQAPSNEVPCIDLFKEYDGLTEEAKFDPSNLHEQIDKEQEYLNSIIQQKMKEARDVLELQEKIFISKIQSLLSQNRYKDILKKEYESKIADLNNMQFDEKFFAALEEAPQEPDTDYESESIRKVENAIEDFGQKACLIIAPELAVADYSFSDMITSGMPKFTQELKEMVGLKANEDYIAISYLKSKNPADLQFQKEFDWKQITKVRLDFHKDCLSESMILVLCHGWKDLGQITDLKMNLNHKDFTDKGLALLCKDARWASEHLEAFEINLKGCNIEDDSTMILFSGPMTNMKNVKRLKLDFRGTKITNQTLQNLSEYVLPVLSDLEVFQLHLGGTRVDNFGKLSSNVRQVLHSVKTFTLDLKDTQFKSSEIRFISEKMIALLVNVEHLALDFSGLSIDDRCVDQIFLAIKSVSRQIRSFSMNLSNTLVANNSMIRFVKESFAQMNMLEKLSLYLSGTKVNDKSMKLLCSAIASKPIGLREFALTLNDTGVTDTTIDALSKWNMTNCTKFVLELNGTAVKDAGMSKLFTSLNSAHRISTLALHLFHTHITDASIQVLAACESLFHGWLENFTIVLLATKVTDTSIIQLLSSIRPKILKHLALELGNTTITDQTLLHFAIQVAADLRSIQDLSIGLSGTLVSDAGVYKLCKSLIMSAVDVKRFALSLRNTKVTNQSVEEVLSFVKFFEESLEDIDIDMKYTQVDSYGLDAIESIESRERFY